MIEVWNRLASGDMPFAKERELFIYPIMKFRMETKLKLRLQCCLCWLESSLGRELRGLDALVVITTRITFVIFLVCLSTTVSSTVAE
jgi:hypothetical protein